MRTRTPSLQALRKHYETAKSLGAAMLACNAVLVIDGYENLHILLQNFQRPITSMHDPADVDYAGGLQGTLLVLAKPILSRSGRLLKLRVVLFQNLQKTSLLSLMVNYRWRVFMTAILEMATQSKATVSMNLSIWPLLLLMVAVRLIQPAVVRSYKYRRHAVITTLAKAAS